MVNEIGVNGHYNGTCPPDDILGPALHEYSRKSLPLNQRCDYLFKDFDYKIGLTTLKKLNREFNVPTVKKPPPNYVASTMIAELTMNNVLSHTVRRLMADIDPDGAEARFPGWRCQPKKRGHLTDTGIYYEVHFDGHEKLNFKALVCMGPVGIDIYGSRCHLTGRMIKLLVVPILPAALFVQATVDGGSETGEMYAAHLALCQYCMPQLTLEEAPAFVPLKSTDNITIESSWHFFTDYVGHDIKEIILLRKALNYFNPAHQFHIDLFSWLWPKIVQLSLNDFVEYWNDHKIRSQRYKLLPSGFSPNYICDFPDKFGLTDFATPVAQHLVDELRVNIPKSYEDCYRWVSDEFNTKAWEIHDIIGAPKFLSTDGWTIFCQMLPHFVHT
ncbi:hypothetical protein B0H17DRAFT_1163930 [Mycena rosella]|uniref:Uncharacterized protein n=1 Tax=Mycena rosella TaxID=1033263 RepID=A0AAD7CBG6_MYCRO|nr:hypothetical protein B0H17DRAFT_1163930 [Mycena rosella]